MYLHCDSQTVESHNLDFFDYEFFSQIIQYTKLKQFFDFNNFKVVFFMFSNKNNKANIYR